MRIQQGGNHAPVGKIEHGQIQGFTGFGGLDRFQQGLADGTFAQHPQPGYGGICRVRCDWRGQTVQGQAGKGGDGGFAVEHIQGGSAGEIKRHIVVGTAGIVRIGRGDQCLPAFIMIDHQGLAVVGAKVRQGQPTAQGDGVFPQRIGQPAGAGAVAQPGATQGPGPGPGRIGGAQDIQIGHDHLRARRLQAFQHGRMQAAVGGVDRVGDDDHAQVRLLRHAREQGFAQLPAQRAKNMLFGTAEIIEQEHVQQYQMPGLADHGQGLVKDLLLAVPIPVDIDKGPVGEKTHGLDRTPR